MSVLEVAEPSLWAELEARVALEPHLGEHLDATRRVVLRTFETEALPRLQQAGVFVLVRYARRDAVEARRVRDDLAQRVAALPFDARRVLHAAQRHALDAVVIGSHAWDPVNDAPSVRALYGAGLLEPISEGPTPHAGRYHLHPDLPPPPEVPYDFEEAVMPETDDLAAPGPSPLALLHDLAGLAAALDHVAPRRTHQGAVARADARRLGRRLGSDDLANDGDLEGHPRWARALRALEALGAVSMDPIDRTLHLDHGLEPTLAGTDQDALDRLVHKLVERDLHVVLPALRTALHQAGNDAIDEVLFLEILREQQRDVLFTPWRRDGTEIYPAIGEEPLRPFDEEGFDTVEAPMIRDVLARVARLGLIRRAPGVFAATEPGRRWAGVDPGPQPPIWVSSDLEVVVPPDAITPWERFQLERLGRCVGRDVVDRYRLDRKGVQAWLSTHALDEALDLLRRRGPAVPATVVDTLTAWARSAERVVLVRGVLLEDAGTQASA